MGHADGVNKMSESMYTVKIDTDVSVVACREMGLEANVEKTEYMVMFGDQNAV